MQSGSCVNGCVSSGTTSPLLPLQPFISCLMSYVWFFRSGFCYNGSVHDLVYLTVAHPVSKYSLWTDWEEKGLIVSPQLWMVTGLRLFLLWFHRDTLEQIVSALMDSTVELELFLSTVDTGMSHPYLFAQVWYITDVCKDSVSSIGPSREPIQTSSSR